MGIVRLAGEAGSSRVLGLSLSGSERLKATRGSHAPAVRHLSLHLFLCPSLVPTALSLSTSTSARLSLHSQTSLDPGHQVNRRRDAYSRRGADRSSGWFFWPRGAVIYYTCSQHDEECITSSEVELEFYSVNRIDIFRHASKITGLSFEPVIYKII